MNRTVYTVEFVFIEPQHHIGETGRHQVAYYATLTGYLYTRRAIMKIYAREPATPASVA